MNSSANYLGDHLPPSIVEKLEARSFQDLCEHLRSRSDEVQNIDLMTVSGFCRNCLAKWLVLEARKLSDELKGGGGVGDVDADQIVRSLDAMGYDEAAHYIYGTDYGDWKKRHSKKASEEQMQRFNDSKPLWAKHEKHILAKRTQDPDFTAAESKSTDKKVGYKAVSSNVCCQDVDEVKPPPPRAAGTTSRARQVPSYVPPQVPPLAFTLGVLTISDRASAGEYESGDQSGPAVKHYVFQTVASSPGCVVKNVEMATVPDEMDEIHSKLAAWADQGNLDLILTTGGTGFSVRDVTPEATLAVVDRPCAGLVSFCTMECSKAQPLASLSRGTAGVRGKTLIANLPGNPKGVGEIIPILLPLALNAIYDMKKCPP